MLWPGTWAAIKAIIEPLCFDLAALFPELSKILKKVSLVRDLSVQNSRSKSTAVQDLVRDLSVQNSRSKSTAVQEKGGALGFAPKLFLGANQ